MSSLRHKLSDLATLFAESVLDAIRTASIDELTGQVPAGARRTVGRPVGAPAASPAPARRRGGRLARRSEGDIAEVVESIVGLLRLAPKGLRAEEIRVKLGLQSKELPRPLKEATAAGRVGKSGQKRATTYFLKGAGGSAPKAAPARRGRPRKAGRAGKARKPAPAKATSGNKK